MIVVSDSTTLIVLSDLDKLEYLQNLFSTIYIPRAVYEEISFKHEFYLKDFVKICEPRHCELIDELKMLLDDGESDAIALAVEKRLPLIIDEKKGRKIATNLKVPILGLVGIIYLNIKKQYLSIEDATIFFEKAKENNYRISQKLVDEMLGSCKEQ
jgi:predicted nucleic acid-binding protein